MLSLAGIPGPSGLCHHGSALRLVLPLGHVATSYIHARVSRKYNNVCSTSHTVASVHLQAVQSFDGLDGAARSRRLYGLQCAAACTASLSGSTGPSDWGLSEAGQASSESAVKAGRPRVAQLRQQELMKGVFKMITCVQDVMAINLKKTSKDYPKYYDWTGWCRFWEAVTHRSWDKAKCAVNGCDCHATSGGHIGLTLAGIPCTGITPLCEYHNNRARVDQFALKRNTAIAYLPPHVIWDLMGFIESLLSGENGQHTQTAESYLMATSRSMQVVAQGTVEMSVANQGVAGKLLTDLHDMFQGSRRRRPRIDGITISTGAAYKLSRASVRYRSNTKSGETKAKRKASTEPRTAGTLPLAVPPAAVAA